MRTKFLCISVLRVASGPRVELARCKSALNSHQHPLPPPPPPHTHTHPRLTLCYIVLVFFSPFSIAITSLGEERAYLRAFRTFVLLVLLWFCWCLGAAEVCYRYFKFRKAFSKFYRRHSALLEKYSVSLKTLLQQDISEPEFYGDLVYRFRRMYVNLTFRSNSENLLTVIKELAIAWILCGRLHA